MKKKINILITCAGTTNNYVGYFQDALHDLGEVHTANITIDTVAMNVSDRPHLVPPVDDKNYISELLNVSIKNDISLIIPMIDIDLFLLSASKELFEKNGIKVIVSDSSVITTCNDKIKMSIFLKKLGILSPKTYCRVKSAIAAIDSKKLKFPLIIKPRFGIGSLSTYIVNNREELLFFYRRSKTEIEKTYIPLIFFKKNHYPVIIQEVIHGQEYGLDVVNDLNGENKAVFVKRKVIMGARETEAAETVYNDAIYQIGKKIGKNLRHNANLDIDVISSNEKHYVIDLNPRFGGGYPYSHLAGANIPKAIIAWSFGQPLKSEWFTIKNGIKSYKGRAYFFAKNN